jgi:uncharacterized protein YkwD
MKLKTAVWLIIIIGVIVGIKEGVHQKGFEWLRSTDIGKKILASKPEESLPGPLRGLLDPTANSHLTSNGVVNFTNQQRELNGLAPLHTNAKLSKAAESKIDDMFAQQYFEHESPDGKHPADIISATGYEYILVGENLALGNFSDDKVLVQAWMDSPGHRANILNNKFQEIGVAVRRGEFDGKTVWLAVQEFGTPLSSCPAPKVNIKAEIDANRLQINVWQSELQSKKAALDSNRYKTREEYNEAVDSYNELAQRINALTTKTQGLVKQYNDSVNAFNKCLESNS